MLGSIRDKAKLAKAFGDEFETAVIKATNTDEIAPKQKHVECIVLLFHCYYLEFII